MLPERVIAVDWSGARTGERRKIWLAEGADGRCVRLVDGWTREAVTEELVRAHTAAVSRGARVVIGLDFSFAFPAWYARANGWRTGREIWQAFPPARVERVLAGEEPPFWGRGAQRTKPAMLHDGSDTPPLRATEHAREGARPFSVFQLVGAGSVGTASLRGLATLHALAEAGACIWPFDDDLGAAGAVVVELWPRLCAPQVVKSQAAARTAHLASLATTMPSVREHAAAVRDSDDAFDALVAMVALWRSRASLARLPATTDMAMRLEGRLWEPDA